MLVNSKQITILSGLALIIGAMLPWGKALFVSVSGTEGDGVIVLGIGFAVAIAGLRDAQSKPTGRLLLAAGAFSAFLAFWTMNNMGSVEGASVGMGVWLTIMAGITLVWHGWKMIKAPEPATNSTPDS